MYSEQKYGEIIKNNADKRKQFCELVLNSKNKNYRSQTFKFLETNKDDISKNLSKSARKMLERDVFKNKQIEPSLLDYYLTNCLSEDKIDSFVSSIILLTFPSHIFSSETNEEDGIVKMSFDNADIQKYYVTCSQKEQDKIRSLCECLDINIELSDEALAFAKNEALESTINEKNTEIENLKSKASQIDIEHKKELTKLKEDNAKKIKEKDDEIKGLLNKVKELESREKEKNKEPTETSLTNKAQENKDVTPASPQEQKRKGVSIDIEKALDDLEGRTFIGVVKPDGIKIEKGWVVVTPIVPILSEDATINRGQLASIVDYRSDYSTALLFLYDDVLQFILPEESYMQYNYLKQSDKYDVLYSALCDKLIFFSLDFREIEGSDKYKLNARLVKSPIIFKNFTNSTYVPSLDCSKKEFEAKIAKREDLVLESYPYSLSSCLRYVLVEDTIYEINYIPNEDASGMTYSHWKYNDQNAKDFKKLALKINKDSSDDYLQVPNQYNDDSYDLYVKNIAFIGTSSSKKVPTIFDENEFIHNVFENAKSRNLFYEEDDLKNFHVALKSSNLVILAGLSGIGKTKLPMVYANTLGLDKAKNNVLFVPISPSFLEPEDVLGYVRPIAEEGGLYNAEYIESQTGLVSFLIDAEEHKDSIHLVIFDEMNLSQIEHWFAPFISLLEQNPDSRELKLFSDNLCIKNGDKYPSSILIGENVFFVGTINIDETTKTISDRLLDRAIIVNLSAPSFSSLKTMGTAKSEIYSEISYSRFMSAVKPIGNSTLEFSDREFSLLNDINAMLVSSTYGKSISFRSLNKMASYLANSANVFTRSQSLDFALAQIVIKKISGSSEELEEILDSDSNKGLLGVLEQYKDLGNFEISKKEISAKNHEMIKYGFAR